MRYDYSSIGFYTFDCLGRPVTRIPPNGDTDFVEEITLAVSGAAGCPVIVASKHGLKTLAVGGVGYDPMGDWVLERLQHFEVDTTTMQRCEGVGTSSTIVATRPDGSRPALHMKGATGAFEVTDAMLDQVLDARVVHVGGTGLMDRMDGEPTARLLREAKRRGCITTLDVFAAQAEDLRLVEGLLPHTDYFLPSIEEASVLSGRESREEVAEFFLDKGAGCVVLTLGADGAYYHHSDGTRFEVPAYRVDVVCTCGCGDVFDAGFSTGLCRGMDPETAVRFAQAASAQAATGLGSQAGVESFERTWEVMESWPTR